MAFAVLAAMVCAVFSPEPLFLCLGAALFRNPAALLHNHVAARTQAERSLQLSKMIEFRSGGMGEWFEPRRVDEVRHLDAIDEEYILLDRIAGFIGVEYLSSTFRP